MRKYGHGSNVRDEDLNHCVANVWPVPYDYSGPHQCNRKRGFGKDRLLCKQHAKVQESERGYIFIPKDKEAPNA